MERFKKKLRTALFALLTAGVCAGSYLKLRDAIPDQIYVVEGEQDALREICTNPLVTCEPAVEASAGGGYTVEYAVGGILPLKTVQVEPTGQKYVYAGGQTVGIYMETRGVLVIDDGELTAADGSMICPAEHILQAGDYIRTVNGTELSDKKELIRMISESGGSELTLGVIRNGEEITVAASPSLTSDGSYKLGIWVRDNIQGIGTLTYVDEQGNFGALGHGISDIDTGDMLTLKCGELYNAQIISIVKGTNGNPGELQGVIHYEDSEKIGSIADNQSMGIYGTLNNKFTEGRWLPVGYKQEMEEGAASILAAVDGEVREYSIEITAIDMNKKDTNKSFTIKVTDPRLLELTGGIVQGMSGAPVLQNGKLVGAVTHVFVRDSKSGYGIFIENMLQH